MPCLPVIFHKQLGDLVLLEPALRALQARYDMPIGLVTRGGHRPLVELMEGVEIHTRCPLKRPARTFAFDVDRKTAWHAWLSGAAKKRLMVPDHEAIEWYHRWVFRTIRQVPLDDRYVAEFFYSLVARGGTFERPRLRRPPAEWAPPGFPCGDYVLLNPTSGWRRKAWSPARWVEVLQSVQPRSRVVVTGGGQDWQVAHCAAITQSGKAEAITQTTLQHFLWLVANARAVWTVDGAATHLASAFGTPSITIYGPTDPRNWHGGGEGQIALRAPAGEDGKHRMDGIDAEVVAGAITGAALA